MLPAFQVVWHVGKHRMDAAVEGRGMEARAVGSKLGL